MNIEDEEDEDVSIYSRCSPSETIKKDFFKQTVDTERGFLVASCDKQIVYSCLFVILKL